MLLMTSRLLIYRCGHINICLTVIRLIPEVLQITAFFLVCVSKASFRRWIEKRRSQPGSSGLT